MKTTEEILHSLAVQHNSATIHGFPGFAGTFADAAKHIQLLEEKVVKLEADKARLDWCESQADGSSCVARQSTRGRGFRLHNTGSDDSGWHLARRNFREAIDAAMNQKATE